MQRTKFEVITPINAHTFGTRGVPVEEDQYLQVVITDRDDNDHILTIKQRTTWPTEGVICIDIDMKYPDGGEMGLESIAIADERPS